MAAAFCGNCGTARNPGARFCGGCGQALPLDEQVLRPETTLTSQPPQPVAPSPIHDTAPAHSIQAEAPELVPESPAPEPESELESELAPEPVVPADDLDWSSIPLPDQPVVFAGAPEAPAPALAPVVLPVMGMWTPQGTIQPPEPYVPESARQAGVCQNCGFDALPGQAICAMCQ